MARTPPEPSVMWLSSELGSTLSLAGLLTGESVSAANLVAEMLARDPAWWSEGAAPADGSVQARRLLVEAFLASRSPSRCDDTLAGLDPLALAVVVLRDGERLPAAEIFSTIDRPKRLLQQAMAEHPVGAYANDLAERGEARPDPGVVVARYPGAARRVQTRRARRRRWMAVAASAVVAGLVTAVAGPTAMVKMFPPEVRPVGSWRFSHIVDDVDGWDVAGRTVTSTMESTTLINALSVEACEVIVGHANEPPGTVGAQRRVGIGPFRGTVITGTEAGPQVVWQYAPGAYAVVSCAVQIPERQALQIARAVRFQASPVRLPMMLASLPPGYKIASVSESVTEAWTVASLTLRPLREETEPAVTVQYTPMRGTATVPAMNRTGRSGHAQGSVWSLTGRPTTCSHDPPPSKQLSMPCRRPSGWCPTSTTAARGSTPPTYPPDDRCSARSKPRAELAVADR